MIIVILVVAVILVSTGIAIFCLSMMNNEVSIEPETFENDNFLADYENEKKEKR